MTEDQDLDARLAAGIPEMTVAPGALRRFRSDVVTEERRSRRRRLGWVGALSTLTLAAGALAGPATADAVREYLAQTGVTCRGTDCGSPDSELIDLGASDLSEYVAAQYPDYVILPPRTTKAELIAEVQKLTPQIPDDGVHKNYAPDSNITGTYESVSYCAWMREWLVADKAHDTARRDRATEVIVTATSWPLMSQPTIAYLSNAYSAAAQEGDRDGVETGAALSNCGAGKLHPEWMTAKGLNG